MKNIKNNLNDSSQIDTTPIDSEEVLSVEELQEKITHLNATITFLNSYIDHKDRCLKDRNKYITKLIWAICILCNICNICIVLWALK